MSNCGPTSQLLLILKVGGIYVGERGGIRTHTQLTISSELPLIGYVCLCLFRQDLFRHTFIIKLEELAGFEPAQVIKPLTG